MVLDGFRRCLHEQLISQLPGAPFSPSWKKKSTLKNVLTFSQKKVFFVFGDMELSSHKIKKFQEGTFRAQKIKKKLRGKSFLYFRKWIFLAANLENSYIFSKQISYISRVNLQILKNQKFLMFLSIIHDNC